MFQIMFELKYSKNSNENEKKKVTKGSIFEGK